MEKHLKILIVEDNPTDVLLLKKELVKANLSFESKTVDTKRDFIRELDEFNPDLVLSDYSLPSFNSLEALSIVRSKDLEMPFILVTGSISEDFAVNCMKAGADDYILKGRLLRLPSSIENIFSKKEMKYEKETIASLHKELQRTNEVISERNKSITYSINYAKRIQEAMLPEKNSLIKIFPQSFILNKPKDIVSGDFYWFAEHNNKFFIAAADCSGHGVPGALLSIIGYTLLNQIISEATEIRPSEILKRLNIGIRKALKQGENEKKNWDGMDIALCSIDRMNYKIEFAGANRHLFHFSEGIMQVIKGDRHGIGGVQPPGIREYSNSEMSYERDDSIYLFSDGYADQFGGEKHRKMMRGNFVNLIQSYQAFDMHEQKQLFARALEEWKGNLEQTDDILLIGIKL